MSDEAKSKIPPRVVCKVGNKKYVVLRENHSGEELLMMMRERRRKLIEDHGEIMGNWINDRSQF